MEKLKKTIKRHILWQENKTVHQNTHSTTRRKYCPSKYTFCGKKRRKKTGQSNYTFYNKKKEKNCPSEYTFYGTKKEHFTTRDKKLNKQQGGFFFFYHLKSATKPERNSLGSQNFHGCFSTSPPQGMNKVKASTQQIRRAVVSRLLLHFHQSQ